MASLILELFVSYYRLFTLYPVYLTLFFVVYFTNTEKNEIFQQNIGI